MRIIQKKTGETGLFHTASKPEQAKLDKPPELKDALNLSASFTV